MVQDNVRTPKVAGIFGECCISVLEKVATPWSGRCHPMEADILC